MPKYCLECQRYVVYAGRNGRRGLCQRCGSDEEIRAKYPRLSSSGTACPQRGNQDHGIDGVEPEPAEYPTDAEPGTEEKIRVLAERFAKRQELWHPDDAKLPSGRGAIRCDLPKVVPRGLRFWEIYGKSRNSGAGGR